MIDYIIYSWTVVCLITAIYCFVDFFVTCKRENLTIARDIPNKPTVTRKMIVADFNSEPKEVNVLYDIKDLAMRKFAKSYRVNVVLFVLCLVKLICAVYLWLN